MSRQHDREALAAKRQTTKTTTRKPPEPSPESEEDLRSAVGNSGMSRLLDPRVTDTIEAELGGGKPMASTVAAQRAPEGNGQDVRIHDDGTAADLSRELGAVAFTYGRDIFLSGNAPALESADGQAMLRHELTHVDQQATSGTTRPRRVSSPQSPAEQQAARAQHGGAAGAGPSVASVVHRQDESEEGDEGEEAQMMPADTVHRQEEEEEELMAMPADTVHRTEDGPEQEEAGGPAPANPALAALYEATVLDKHRAAIAALEEAPPNTEAAHRTVGDAWEAVAALSSTYEGSDPLLYAQLRRYMNSLNITIEQLNAILNGPRSPEGVHSVLTHPQVMGLGEQLRDQLH